MKDVTAVVIKGKYGTIGIPTITHIPLFYLATCRVYAKDITHIASLSKETFDDRREENPVRIGWVNAAKSLEFVEVSRLGCLVKRLP